MNDRTHQWLISFTQTALNQLRALPSAERMVVFRVVRQLLRATNPLAESGVKKLKGSDNDFRARAGAYRILFEIESVPRVHMKRDYKGTLHVNAVKHRRDAYKR